jgi:hypothetical protein
MATTPWMMQHTGNHYIKNVDDGNGDELTC